MKKARSSKRKHGRVKEEEKEEPKKSKRVVVDKSSVWTIEERCRLAEALESEKIMRHPHTLFRYVGNTKKTADITGYQKYNRMVEQGKPFPEFKDRAPLDTWIELAEKNVSLEDKRAEESIPQIMTVAALEKINQNQSSFYNQCNPNYSNIYNFLSTLLRNGELPDLPPIDAQAVLRLLDELVNKLANSLTMVQKEFLHEAFSVLRNENAKDAITKESNQSSASKTSAENNDKKFSSLNPLNVPQSLLELRKKTATVIDLDVNWRTKINVRK